MPSPLSPEKKAFIKVITWTLSMLIALTFINSLFIISSVGPGIKIPFVRKVASVPNIEYVEEDFISPIIEFNCRQIIANLKITTKAPTTRVSFKSCKKIGRITNESNNNQGDVFPLPGKKWTSDFIFLSPGSNTLKVPVNGKVHTIEITREMVKKQATKKAL